MMTWSNLEQQSPILYWIQVQDQIKMRCNEKLLLFGWLQASSIAKATNLMCI